MELMRTVTVTVRIFTAHFFNKIDPILKQKGPYTGPIEYNSIRLTHLLKKSFKQTETVFLCSIKCFWRGFHPSFIN